MTFWILWNYANKWPCDSGFHIPTSSEISNLFTRLTHLWIVNNVSTYTDYLLIPPAYYLNRSTGTLNTQYWIIRLWSCDMTNYTSATAFYINENNVIYYGNDKPANGFPIRAFKDTPVTPDSSWTVMYQWTGDDGIFRDSTKWLISIVDGDIILTIQDHNVWATTVWQPWDTVDDNNAGLFYQFWNNYWFPYSWATEFYTTTQNVSWYWPQNPYLDSHFVKISSNYRFLNTSGVTNIWWWQESWTKILTEPKSITYKVLTGVEVWQNPTLGLFSFTKDDWNTWTTIADKDLWANGVWQEWNLYQWWNDYWFPATGTVTRSTASVNVDNYWPWNHYNTSTWTRSNYAIYSTTYSTSPYTYWKDLWWWTTDTIIARQWPCSNWRHVPSRQELSALLTCAGTQTSVVCPMIHLPYAGSIVYDDASISNQWITVRYWTSDGYQNGRAYALTGNIVWGTFSSENPLAVGYSTNIASWFSIRPFYNTGVVPDSQWNQILYNWNHQIWHNTSMWMISFTNDWGTTWATLSDKNLWATEVWNDGDTMTQANCGYYFQRWNNYWFPFDGQNISTTTALVSAWWYWPWNYYSSSNFVTTTANPATWLANPILNLRWWLGTIEDRRWPCPEGFHIPTRTEWSDIPSIYGPLGFITSGHYRYQTSGNATTASGSSLGWWTCEVYGSTSAYRVRYTTSTISSSAMYYQYYIRPFKDVPVVPSVETGWFRTYQWIATRNINQIYAQWNKVRPPDATKIVLNAYTKTLAVGDTFKLIATLQPEATHDTVTWGSSDTAIATVGSSTGTITGVASGTCTITATATSWVTATCTVTVAA